MSILLGILELAQEHYLYQVEHEDEKESVKQSFGKTTKSLYIYPHKANFYLVEREDEKEAIKQSIWKNNQVVRYIFFHKRKKF